MSKVFTDWDSVPIRDLCPGDSVCCPWESLSMGVRWLVISISHDDNQSVIMCLKDDNTLSTWNLMQKSSTRWSRLKVHDIPLHM